MKRVGRSYPAQDHQREGDSCAFCYTRHLRIIGLFVVFIVVVWAFSCEAQDVDQAKQSFRKGVERFKSEDYTGALFAFEESYRILPRVSTLFNIGMCQKALSLNLNAIATFQQFLKKDAADSNPLMRQDAMNALDELEQRVGKLKLEDVPDGSLVTIDGRGGQQVIATPLEQSLFVDPGQHAVRISKSGFELFETEVVVEAGAEVKLAAVLKPSVDKDIVNKNLALPERKAGVLAPLPKREGKGVSLLFVAGLASGALGLVGTGVGIYCTFEYYKDKSRAKDAEETIAGLDDKAAKIPHIEFHNDIVEREIPADKKGMIAGYVAGGVLLLGGLVITLVELTDDEDGPRSDSVSLRPDGVTLTF